MEGCTQVATVAARKDIAKMSTEQVAEELIYRRFWQNYFSRGKYPDFWEKWVMEAYNELKSRGVLS